MTVGTASGSQLSVNVQHKRHCYGKAAPERAHRPRMHITPCTRIVIIMTLINKTIRQLPASHMFLFFFFAGAKVFLVW